MWSSFDFKAVIEEKIDCGLLSHSYVHEDNIFKQFNFFQLEVLT